jgi:hypothetical protein
MYEVGRVGLVDGIVGGIEVLLCRPFVVVVVVDVEVPTRKVGRRPSKWYPSLSMGLTSWLAVGKRRGIEERNEETEQF